jgi:hypothetical protein
MIIAIDSGNEDLAGAIVYWRLSADTNGDDLNNALTDHGVAPEHHVRMPSPRAALHRAVKEFAKGPVFMRAGRKAGGLYLVEQVTGDEGPEFEVVLEARLNLAGQPQFSKHEDRYSESELNARYWHHVFHLGTSDISSWLIEQAGLCDALSLRDTGGVYFVPRHSLDAWRARTDALDAVSHCRVHLVPAMNSNEAFDAVLQSLLDECVAFTTQLDDDLTCGDLGARALRNRSEQAVTFLDKLDRYGKLLGAAAEGKLDVLREQIEEQKANAIAAALTAEEEAA